MSILGHGIYDLAEAAQFTGLRLDRIREWFKGRSGSRTRQPVFESDYPVMYGECMISFLDLVEVFVAGQLRNYGVSLQYIRRAHKRLRADWDTKHPFSKKDIQTNGKMIFTYLKDDHETKFMYEVVTKNQVFESVILPTLKNIDYSPVEGMAERWHLAPHVVLDPEVCFGKPVIEAVAITTRVIAESFFANKQDLRAVANWFDIEPAHVQAAVAFESAKAA